MPQLTPHNFRNLIHHKNQYYVGPTSFGSKYWLYCTTIRQRPFAFLISKKNQEAFSLKTTFPQYTESVFECEMGRELLTGQWNIVFSDVLVSKGETVDHMTLEHRYTILQQFIDDEFTDQPFCYGNVILNKYYPSIYLSDLVQRSAKHIPFKPSGLIFRHISHKNKDLLYVFQEHKTHRTVPEPIVESESDSEVEAEVEAKIEAPTTPAQVQRSAVFRIERCPELEKYMLIAQRDGEMIRYGYACVQTIETSHFLLHLFYDDHLRLIPMRTSPTVECVYNTIFRRWQPVKVTSAPISSIHSLDGAGASASI